MSHPTYAESRRGLFSTVAGGLIFGAVFSVTAEATPLAYTRVVETGGAFVTVDTLAAINDSQTVAFGASLADGTSGVYTSELNRTAPTVIAETGSVLQPLGGGSPYAQVARLEGDPTIDIGRIYFEGTIVTTSGTTRQSVFEASPRNSGRADLVGAPDFATFTGEIGSGGGEYAYVGTLASGHQAIQASTGDRVTTAGSLGAFHGAPAVTGSEMVFLAEDDFGHLGIYTYHFASNRLELLDTGSLSADLIDYAPPAVNALETIVFPGQDNENHWNVYGASGGVVSQLTGTSSSGHIVDAVAINDTGEFVYQMSDRPDIGSDSAIYSQGGERIIGTGDALLGRRIESLELGREALANDGTLAFSARLSDGSQVVVRGEPVVVPAKITRRGMEFHVEVTETSGGPQPTSSPIWFDPLAVFGYEYVVEGSRFARVTLPDIGDPSFELYLYDALLDGFVFYTLLAPEASFDFTALDPMGVSRFRILGIDTSLGLDPSDPLAFPTGLNFTSLGSAVVTMTPLAGVPEPGTLASLMLGLFFCLRTSRR